MFTLPTALRRSYLRAFWVLLGVIGIGILFALSFLLPTLRLTGFVYLLASVLLAAGIVWPEIASLPYRIWNKVVPVLCGGMQTCLLAVIYVLVFTIVGITGSRLVLSRERQRSGWMHWPQNAETPVESSKRSPRWVLNYIKWAVKSGNSWTCILLPFWLSISTKEIEEDVSLPASTYTLY